MPSPLRGRGPPSPAMPPSLPVRSFRRALAALGAAALAAALPAAAGIPLRDGDGHPIRWDLEVDQPNVQQGKVTWTLDIRGVTDEPVGDATEQDAAYAAVAAWEAVPGTRVHFQEDPGRTAADRNAKDRINLVTWKKFVLGPFTLAATFTSSSNGVFTDGDVVLNDQDRFFRWSTTTPGTEGAVDVQAALTHEFGHLCGLDHSPVGESTMRALIRTGAIHARTLETDDGAALLDAYPTAIDPDHGFVSGVLRIGRRRTARGVPVFALDPESGRPVACTMTGDGGAFRIPALLPGTYLVAAAPLESTTGYSDWWSRSPPRIEAAVLAAEAGEEGGGEPVALEVQGGYPAFAGTFAIRRARRRGTGEPDGDPERARPLAAGAWAGGAFERSQDEDWFRIRVEGTDPIEVRVRGWAMGSSGDADLAILAADGVTELDRNHDARPLIDREAALGLEGTDPDPVLASFTPPAPGDYFLRVRAQPQSESGTPGAFYLLRWRPLPPPPSPP